MDKTIGRLPGTHFSTFGEWQRYHREAERYSMRGLSVALAARGVRASYSVIGKREQDESGPEEITPRPPREYIERFAELTGADVAVGLRLAGYPTEPTAEPPENFADWPPELRQALAHAKSLPPETQGYIFKLWLEQSRAHADIETRRQEAERRLEEREQRLRELGK